MAGLVQIFLSKALGLRYVGFCSSESVTLPLLEHKEKLKTWDRTPLRTEYASADEGGKALRILSHNVWCHIFQQWYAPSASKRLDCLVKAIETGGYDIVMLQELFLLRLGPFANTHSFEKFTHSMLAAGELPIYA